MKRVYFFNNDAGVNAEGLKNSIYVIKQALETKRLIPLKTKVLEQNMALEMSDKEKNGKLKNFSVVQDNCERCKIYAESILKAQDVPVLIAGDHSIGAGSVAATASFYKNTAIVWIDAHGDINTENTSITGNIHGMPVASFLGIGSEQLNALSGEHFPINPENMIYLGLRDLDFGEVETLERLPIKAYSYQTICERGLNTVLEEISAQLKTSDVHISLDLDSMDPKIMPGVSVPAKNGFSVDEVKRILQFFQKNFVCRAFDVVEYNAFRDVEEKTLKHCLDLLEIILQG